MIYIDILEGSAKEARNLHRSEKTAIAIKNGAKGVVIFNKVDKGVLLTGTASVTGELIPIPAICIAKEKGFELKEKLKGKKKVEVHIAMTNNSDPIKARNMIATLKGSELPDEKIVIGGHLDSWDLATGAIDNGIGSFAILDIARAFKANKLQPKRTIQFVMFMGEEQGLLGSTHMVEQAVKNGTIDQIKYMFNIDMGWKVEVTVGTLRLRCGGAPNDRACLEALCATVRPVPGGSALEPYPPEAPTLELATAGGVVDIDLGGVAIYADGTVQYYGPSCARWRGRRGQLTAAAMATLMATVDQSGFATLAETPKQEMVRLLDCSDDVYASVSVRGTTRTVGCTRVKAIDDVAAAIQAAVFANPCE